MTGDRSRPTDVLPARVADASDVLDLSRQVFGEYAHLSPEPSSLRDTVENVSRDIDRFGGLLVREGTAVPGAARPGRLLACTQFSEHDGGFWLRRVSVAPDVRHAGLATSLARAAEEVARERGYTEVRVGARTALREVADFWRRRGFRDIAVHDHWIELARPLPVWLPVPTAQDMRALGVRLSGRLRGGDLVVLSGDLGAGKTTLAGGIGAGLGVRGAVTSPTFVIARVHPSTGDGPPLVHVDAYRLADLAEVDDLDLDASLEESVTVVEWGAGMVEGLSASRLEVHLRRGVGVPDDESRTVTVRGVGDRWTGADLRGLVDKADVDVEGA